MWAGLGLAGVLSIGSGLARPPQPSFHDVVAEAWSRMPQRQDFAAQQGTAAARYAAGGALFPNAPTATGTYVNDKIAGSNYNYITSQVEVSTPLWLPGEGTASQKTAQADGLAVEAAIEASHLALAGQVLSLATQAIIASNTREVAARRLAAAQALAADQGRRFRVGEGSESDSLAADAEAAAASLSLSSADGQLGAARAALAALTGSQALPRLDAPATPRRTADADAVAKHPRIAAAERALAAAQSSARLVRIENRDDPEIGLQGIDEKQPGARWDTRFGVVFRFPFATDARNAPRRAAAEQAITQAQVQLELARREVLVGVQQAAAILSGAEQGAAAAERGTDALAKRRGQIERAWRLGEMPLIELVRADAAAFDADLARDKARTALSAARIAVQLAEGDLP